MLLQAEEVELFVVLVPIAANAFEYGSAVVEGVGHNPYRGLLQGDERTVMKSDSRHVCSPS